jgi:hypothetical protein
MQERMAASLAAKQDAVKWAQQALARYGAAAQAGASAAGATQSSLASDAAELSKALSRLADAGMLAGAPSALVDLAAGRTALPSDPAALARLQSALGKFLGDKANRLGAVAQATKGGRFDASEFQTADSGQDGDGDPGRGAPNRGRADADLTFGRETERAGHFKAQPLPPGAVRNADEWAPIAEAQGAPGTSPQGSTAAATRTYESGTGQEAWRRTLAPRHQSAVKKYFENRK